MSSDIVAVVVATDIYHSQMYEGLFKECVEKRCTLESTILSYGCWEELAASGVLTVNFFTRRLWFDVATLVRCGVTWPRFFDTFSSTLCGRQVLEWELSSEELVQFGTSLRELAEQFGWQNELFFSELQRIGYNGQNLRALRDNPAVGLTREFESRFKFVRKTIISSSYAAAADTVAGSSPPPLRKKTLILKA